VLSVSANGKQWRRVVHETDCPGGTRAHEFAPARARFVRLQAVKPDAPGQPGGRMAVAELELYG